MTIAAPLDPVELARARAFVADGRGRRIRQRAGLSLRDIARSVGVTPATVMQWESGEHVPRAEHVVPYVAVLRRLLAEIEL